MLHINIDYGPMAKQIQLNELFNENEGFNDITVVSLVCHCKVCDE